MTDVSFVLLKNYLDSLGGVNLFDLLHLHSPGDYFKNILHDIQNLVYI